MLGEIEKLTEEIVKLRAEVVAIRSDFSILPTTYFENLSPLAVVGADYVAYRFGCSQDAVVRGRFGTDKIPKFRQKPIVFLKKNVDAVFLELTKSGAEVATEIRYKTKPIRRRKK